MKSILLLCIPLSLLVAILELSQIIKKVSQPPTLTPD